MEEDKILNKILTENIKPISKRYFLIKRYGVMVFGLLITILGAVVFAKIFASILVSGWEYWDYVYDSFGSFLYAAMPLMWILLLVVFTFLTPFILEKTAHGYRYKKIILVLFSILTSIVLGILILKVGAYSGANKYFTNSTEERETSLWVRPNQGRLAGKITLRATDSVILEDYHGKVWAVDVTNLLPASKQVSENSEQVRIVGVEVDENTFIACQVMPLDISSDLNLENPKESLEIRDLKSNSIINDVCNSVLNRGL